MRPEQPCRSGHPCRDHVVAGRGEQVLIPGRGADSCSVARGKREAAGGPRYPGGCYLHLVEVREQVVVGSSGGELGGVEHRGVPGTAHHDDALGVGLHRRPDPLPHRRLAHQGEPGIGFALPQAGHGPGDCGEDLGAGVAMLEDVFPPPFRVGKSGRLREPRDRVGAHRLLVGFFGFAPGEHVGRGQVDEPDCGPLPQRGPNRHVLGRERGEGIEGRSGGLVRGVHQAGQRRPGGGIAQQLDDRLQLFGAFDEYQVRRQVVAGSRHRPGRTGPVVAHAEDGDAGQSSSRQAR